VIAVKARVVARTFGFCDMACKREFKSQLYTLKISWRNQDIWFSSERTRLSLSHTSTKRMGELKSVVFSTLGVVCLGLCLVAVADYHGVEGPQPVALASGWVQSPCETYYSEKMHPLHIPFCALPPCLAKLRLPCKHTYTRVYIHKD